ncbi:MAG: cell division protein ZapD [Halofilum sp. (in: g-proteobacteria)]|nr:cell division protein ZapD [Halofilum sp. (in: g-proteobacteria)]
MSDIDVHEQPLSERFRLFLRVEQLFERLDHHLAGDTVWDTHAALQGVLELLQTVSRGDSKRELIKELDRQRAALARFDERSTVDRSRLQQLLASHQELLDALHARTGTLGAELRGNELVNQLQQRATAGGRPGIVELPSYQEWLQRPVAERHDTVRAWLEPLASARAGIGQCLELVRDSVDWQPVSVDNGFYEQPLAHGQGIQLLRVRLPDEGQPHRFPEISAGRQRFTVRFFTQSTPAERAEQIHGAVRFELACCGV